MWRWFRKQEQPESEIEAQAPRGASRTYSSKHETNTLRKNKESSGLKQKTQEQAVQAQEAPKNEPVDINFDIEAWWKPFWSLSSLVIFMGVLYGVLSHVWTWLDRPVAEVSITGQVRHLNKMELAHTIADNLDGRLLTLSIADVQELVRSEPWVRVAGITRTWPSGLTIELEEEVPVARWGEKGLLNHQGDIFWPELKQEYASLPRLSGPAPDTSRVMSQFHDLNQMFRAVGLNIVSLDLEPRGAWSLMLDNDIKVIVGREAINERLQRFLELYQSQLASRVDEIEQVDIRYTHGVAVKWREKPIEENAG